MATPTLDPTSSLPTVPGFAARFNNISIADTFWLIGFFLSISAVILAIILYGLIINRFYCQPKPSQKEDKYLFTKISATFSATFSLLCIILLFTTFPVCTLHLCGYNLVGNLYYSTIIDAYVLSKLSIYTLFVDRIYNDFFTKIYCYSSKILYILVTMICIVTTTLIMFNVLCIFNFRIDFANFISKTSVIVYILMDITFSGMTLFLFLKPIYNQTSTNQNKQYMKHKIVKYALLSTVAIVSSLIYEFSYAIRMFTGLYHSDSNKANDFMDMSSCLQMIDCIISMICIYLGFVERNVFDKYCKKCHQCFKGQWNIIERRKKTLDQPESQAYQRKPTALDLYKQFLDQPESQTYPDDESEDTLLSIHRTSGADIQHY